MTIRIQALAVLALGLLVVYAAPGATTAQQGLPTITRLIIDYTPAAVKQTESDARFNSDALRKAVAAGLAAQGLLDLGSTAVIQVAAIEVDEFDVRATSNVVMMGHVTSNGVLGASVRIRDGSSAQLRQFHVRTELRLKVDRTGKERNPLENLYKEFARQVADVLTGKASQPLP